MHKVIIMRNLIKQTSTAILSVLLLASCSSSEDNVIENTINPTVSLLTDTGCLENRSDLGAASRADEADGCTFAMTLDGTVAHCKFTDLVYDCNYGKVNVKVSFKDNVLSIVEYPTEDGVDCLCRTNAEFTINDIPDKDFTLKIFAGQTGTGKYNAENPAYSGRVIVKDGGIKVEYQGRRSPY